MSSNPSQADGFAAAPVSAVLVAGAPVSFGVFELTSSDTPIALPDGETVMEILARTGYDGIDLGPRGYLDASGDLDARLLAHRLALSGGWIDLPLSDDDAYERAIPELEQAISIFGTVQSGPIPPRPTLADAGDDIRHAHPGAAPEHRLDDAGWSRFSRNLADAADRVRAHGYEPTFHHHAGTFVETPDEIDRMLSVSDVDITLDTGHLLIGGGEPAEAWSRWGSRINHIHLKDVRRDRLRSIVAAGGGMIDVCSGGTFVPLGDGDLDLDSFMTGMTDAEFAGWLVIEQDIFPTAGYDLARIEDEHLRNREALRRWV
ncbi:MAG: sugar epimerase [Microbacteriaceae bacterium]|nr:MAG: sugar epimerase [Microbacteriaceae bacterium]